MTGLFNPRDWTARTFAALVACSATVALAQQGSNNQSGNAQQPQGEAQQNQQQQAGQQAAQNQQDGEKQSEQQKNEENKNKDKQKLAIVKLEHSDPQQMMALLRSFDQPQAYTAGYRGVAGAPGAPAANQAQEPRRPLMIASDNRSKTLFIRGEESRLGEIRELVKALDTEGDLEAQTMGNARVLPVRHANHQEVMSILQQLQLPASTFQIGDKGIVVLRGDDEEQLSQAEEVITALDEQEEDDKQKDGENNDSESESRSDSDQNENGDDNSGNGNQD